MTQLLFVIVLLVIIGKPLQFLFERYVRSFCNLSVLQELVLNAYLGGLVLYLLALIPLHLFNPSVLLAILVLCSAFISIQLATKLRHTENWNIDSLIRWRSGQVEQAAVLAFFFVSLAIQVVPLTALKFGSIHDTSLHALFVELILENSQIPATHQPYLPAAIIFPQGAHVIFAFAASVLGITPPLAVFYITPLFNAMSVLAAYHFGKVLDERRYAGLSLAFVFTFVSMWPMHITWGGNTFVVGIPLFFITATLLKQALHLGDISKKREVLFSVVVGLFLGYLAAIHVALFLTLALAWMISLFVSTRTHWRNLPKEISNLALSVVTGAFLILPFLIRFVSYYHFPGQNIGLPPDVVSPEVSLLPLVGRNLTLAELRDFLLTIDKQYNLSPYPLTRLVTIALAILLPLNLIRRVFMKSRLSLTESFGLMLGITSILLYFIPLVPVESGRYSLTLYISLMLLLGSSNIWLYTTIRSRVSANTFTRIEGLAGILTVKGLPLILLIFASLYAPFVYYRIAEDSGRLTTMYRIFAVTTDDDYNLMLYMNDNLPRDSIILINPFEPGLFIPALSQKKVIWPFSAYHLSTSYSGIVRFLGRGMLSNEVFDYLQTQGISHIYVGSKSDAFFFRDRDASRWDPYLFLGNPNFRLVKNIGGAYLFKFLFTDPQLVLVDSFEYPSLDEGGWRIVERGNGQGSANITQNNAFDGSSSLMVLSRNEAESYFISVLRKVYLPDPSNVTLSFYLKATSGFGPKDALMMIISDISWDKKLYFVTNPRVPIKYTPVHLPSSEGYFEFNLSRLWENHYNKPLPTSFYIQVLNHDVDGVENVAYIDAISIGANKSHLVAPYNARFTYGLEISDSPLYGWKFSERGNGTGSAKAVTNEYRRGLLISAQRLQDWYWSSVYTDVRLFWGTNNVTLSFYINATERFGTSDALMIIVSDPSWKRQVYFSTNSKVPVPIEPLVLASGEGHYEFNLSEIWKNIHDSPLPDRFFLQILNYDRDGIENVAYVGLIEIKVG